MEIRKANPRGVVAVYIPEYVVGRWWEQLLHNQTALRLKGRLLFAPGVMVTSVPYQLRSSQIAREREERELTRVQRRRPAPRPGQARRERRPGQVRDEPRTPRARAGRAARSRVGERFEAEVGPGRARRALRRPARPSPSRAWSSSGTRCRGSGWSSRSPRAPRATGSGAATPSRCSRRRPDRVDGAVPVRRPGPVRRLRLPARRAARAARRSRRPWCASSWPRLRRRSTSPVARGAGRRATTHGLRWRTRMQYAAPPDGRRGHAHAPLAATSSRSTTA